MELIVLFGIMVLFLFGPRRGGGRPSPLAMAAGAFFVSWMLVAWAVGWSWNAVFGPVPQP